MRDTVPLNWLRAESCQPAKSVTSTMVEALTSASASLPFLSVSLPSPSQVSGPKHSAWSQHAAQLGDLHTKITSRSHSCL